jgi:hypothetical protein
VDKGGLAPSLRLTAIRHPSRTAVSHPYLSGNRTFVMSTVLTPYQITTRILHRWPDEIGKRIGMKA